MASIDSSDSTPLTISTTTWSSSDDSRESDTYHSFEEAACEDELEADIVQLLRSYGVRFIRDIRSYRECSCPIPPIVVCEATDSPTNRFNATGDEIPFCFQVLPQREDFSQDRYGDLLLQDFFVARDNRGSTSGVLHFANTFANLEYDSTLREYRVLNLGGKPSLSLTCREKRMFKTDLVDFIRSYSSQVPQHPKGRCPQVHCEARLLVLSYPKVENIEASDSLNDGCCKDDLDGNQPQRIASLENQGSRQNTLVNYVLQQRERKYPVAFPSYLLYMPNWLVHTIDEQYEHLENSTDLRSVVRSTSQLRNMLDSEIPAEDEMGHVTAPSVVPYKSILKVRPVKSEPTSPFQRRNSSRFQSARRHCIGSLLYPEVSARTDKTV